MKIGIYAKNLDSGGISRFAWNMYYGLSKLLPTYLFSIKSNEFFGKDSIIINSSNHLTRILGLRKVIIENDLDIIIVNSPFEVLSIKIAMFFSKKIKVINVIHTRSILWGSSSIIKKIVIKIAFKLSNSNIAVSGGLMQELIEEGYVNKSNIRTIYNPIVNESFKTFDKVNIKDKEVIEIIMIGWIREIKHQDTVIEAMSKLQHKNVKLNIIGGIYEKEYYKKLVKLINDNKLTERVIFWGQSDKVADILKKMDIFILASESEALPTVLIEAMESGKLCISSDCKFGPKEILNNGSCGPLFEVGNSDQLARILDNIISDDNQFNKYRELARERAKYFSVNNSINQYIELFNRV